MASEVITKAYADLASGQAWRARDALVAYLEHTNDEEALGVLVQLPRYSQPPEEAG